MENKFSFDLQLLSYKYWWMNSDLLEEGGNHFFKEMEK